MEMCIIECWLRSLGYVQYTQAFMDNGYDDLEVCKQIGHPDLDAIGVTKHEDRKDLLRAVQTLREKGGTHVYFILENPKEHDDFHELCSIDEEVSDTDSISEHVISSSEAEVHVDSDLYLDEYEEGKKALIHRPLDYTDAKTENSSNNNIKESDSDFGSEPSSCNGSLDRTSTMNSTSTHSGGSITQTRNNNHVMSNLRHSNPALPGARSRSSSKSSNGSESRSASTGSCDGVIEEVTKRFTRVQLHVDNQPYSNQPPVQLHPAYNNSSSSTQPGNNNIQQQQQPHHHHHHHHYQNGHHLASQAATTTTPSSSSSSSSSSASHHRAIYPYPDPPPPPVHYHPRMHQYPGSAPSAISPAEVNRNDSMRGRCTCNCNTLPRNYREPWREQSSWQQNGYIPPPPPPPQAPNMFSAYNPSSRSQPPPMPHCQPAISSRFNGISELDTPVQNKRYSQYSCPSWRYGWDDDIRGSSSSLHPPPPPGSKRPPPPSMGRQGTLSRIFKFRKSGRKHKYSGHDGDLNASDITMSDDDRIQLMIMVKEGKLSMHEAVEAVKQYEMEKKLGLNWDRSFISSPHQNDYSPHEDIKIPICKGHKRSPLGFFRRCSMRLSKRKNQGKKISPLDKDNYTQPVCCETQNCEDDGYEHEHTLACLQKNSNCPELNEIRRPSFCDLHQNPMLHSSSSSLYRPVHADQRSSHSSLQSRSSYKEPTSPSSWQQSPWELIRGSRPQFSQQQQQQQQQQRQESTPPPSYFDDTAVPNPWLDRSQSARHSYHGFPQPAPPSSPFLGGHHHHQRHSQPPPPPSPHLSAPHYRSSQFLPPGPPEPPWDSYRHLPPPCLPPPPPPSPFPGYCTHGPQSSPTYPYEEETAPSFPCRGRDPWRRPPSFNQGQEGIQRQDSQRSTSSSTNQEHLRRWFTEGSKFGSTFTKKRRLSRSSSADEISLLGIAPTPEEKKDPPGSMSSSGLSTPESMRISQLGQTPKTVHDLCFKLNLESLLPKFLLNGFETLELFRQLEACDLDQLGITDPEQRAKILTAVTLLPSEETVRQGLSRLNLNNLNDLQDYEDYSLIGSGQSQGSGQGQRKGGQGQVEDYNICAIELSDEEKMEGEEDEESNVKVKDGKTKKDKDNREKEKEEKEHKEEPQVVQIQFPKTRDSGCYMSIGEISPK